MYYKEGGKYVKVKQKDYEYDPNFKGLFPRMWSDSPDHIREYEKYVGTKGKPVQVKDPQIGLVHNIGGVGIYGNVTILGNE